MTAARSQWCLSNFFIVTFEHISHRLQKVLLLLGASKFRLSLSLFRLYIAFDLQMTQQRQHIIYFKFIKEMEFLYRF